MTRNYRNRLAIVLFALLSLVFMQLAIAGYSCSSGNMTRDLVAKGATMVQDGMPCTASMIHTLDDVQPSLCNAHCKADPQSADQFQVPAMAPLVDIYADFTISRAPPAPLGALLQAPLLRRTTTPPLAVRNCCFRI